MEVIILAGGLGTRLRSVISDVPKPMAPVKNLPFLHFIFQWLAKYPINNVVMSVGHKHELIENYFSRAYYEIPITYSKEDTPLGTGGGIKLALKKTKGDNVIVINGDTFFPIDLNSFEEFHKNHEGAISMALKTMNDFDRYGAVDLKDNMVLNFQEKKYLKEGVINGGIYILNKSKLSIENWPQTFSFELEILEKEVKRRTVYGKIFEDTFIDIGIPDDYAKAAEIL